MRTCILSCLFLVLTAYTSNAQIIWYVDQNATGGPQVGLSWATAFTDLQQALQNAHYNDQVWVATGVYKPTATNQRNIAFILKKGVKVYGGFKGGETAVAQRDPVANQTRLSGDIGEPGVPTDNSYHVVHGYALDENALLDGFVISDGYSLGAYDSEWDLYGAGLSLYGGPGVANAQPVISNCVFENNQAGKGGGGVYVGFKDPADPFAPEYLVNPVFKGCSFVSNRSNLSGGGLMKAGPTALGDTFLLEDCHFLDNYVFVLYGGGINFESAGASSIVMRNCSFERNYSQGGAGAGFYLPLDGQGGYELNLVLSSCYFFKNNAPTGAGFGVDGRFDFQPDITVNLLIEDCLFEENNSRTGEGSAYMVSMDSNSRLNAELRHNRFLNNVGGTFFATSIICYGQSEANVLVESCYFIGNMDSNNPNTYFAAYNAGGYKVHSRLNNCLFAHNSGGAIFAGGDEQTQVLTEVTNCTFFRNGENPFGKRWYPAFNQPGVQYFNKMNFYNCAIWEPQSNHRLIYNNYQSSINGFWFFFDHCSLSPLVPAPAVIPNNNLVFGDSIYYSTYPAFVDTLGGDFRLSHCSPMMGRGDNEKVFEAGLLEDYDGLPRIRFGRVDLGAYENQDSCFSLSVVEEALQRQSLLLWPNPAMSGAPFNLSLPAHVDGEVRWQIWDNSGRLVSSGMCQSAGLESVVLSSPEQPGVYFVALRTDEYTTWGRLIVGQ